MSTLNSALRQSLFLQTFGRMHPTCEWHASRFRSSTYILQYRDGPFPVRHLSMILFKSSDPPTTIYTANFAITDMDGNRTAYSEAKYRHPSSNASASATPSSAPTTTPGGGEDDMVTVTMEMPDSSAGASPTTTPAGAVAALTNNASSGGRHVRKSDLKFNFVFVLFPALFGLALSL